MQTLNSFIEKTDIPASLVRAIYSPRDDGRQTVFNAMAWFALESVAQDYCDAVEA